MNNQPNQNYPSEINGFIKPNPDDDPSVLSHSELHRAEIDAITQVQTALGTTDNTESIFNRIDGNLLTEEQKVKLQNTSGVNTGDQVSSDFDHNELQNTHNLTDDIDHNELTNTHDLTTDIDHNQITNTHNLTTDINHNSLTNYDANEHFKQEDISITKSQVSDFGTYESPLTFSDGLTRTDDEIKNTDKGSSAVSTHESTFVHGDIAHTNRADLDLVSGTNTGDQTSGDFDHNSLINTHNLTSDIDHNQTTNSHNLTTDIDHNTLTNYSADQHREISDSEATTTNLWSGSKINTELSGKENSLGNPDTDDMVLSSKTNGTRSWTSAGAGDMIKSEYDPNSVKEQVVGVTATQTLSNKTLSSGKFSTSFSSSNLALQENGKIIIDLNSPAGWGGNLTVSEVSSPDPDFSKREHVWGDGVGGVNFLSEVTGDNWLNSRYSLVENSSGNVGVGTFNPQYKLDVDGDVNIPAGSNYKIDGVDIGTGGGGLEWIEKDENYTIKSGEGVLADTSADTWTLTLPASPTAGDFIGVSDSASSFDTENLIIARNGSKIMGEEEDLVVDLKDASFQLIYTGSATGWKLDTNLSMPEEDPIDIGYKSLVSNVMDMTANRGGRFAQTQASNTTYTASSSSGDVWILKINCTGDSTATFTSMTIVGVTTSNTLSCFSGNVYSIIFENYNSTITGRVI